MVYTFAVAYMTFVFGAIPFTDAIIARFVDDSMRSRGRGPARLAVSFGFSSLRCGRSARSSRRERLHRALLFTWWSSLP